MESVTAQPDIKSRFVKIILMKLYNSVSFGCFRRRRGLVASLSNVKHSNSYVSHCFTFAWRAVHIPDQKSALLSLACSNGTGNTQMSPHYCILQALSNLVHLSPLLSSPSVRTAHLFFLDVLLTLKLKL